MITWSSRQYVNGPVILDVRSFTLRMYKCNPNSYFESFDLFRGLCDPRPYVRFLYHLFVD